MLRFRMTPPAASGRRDAKPVVLVPACNRMLGHHPSTSPAKQVHRRGAAGRLPAADRARRRPDELDDLLDDRRRRAAHRLAVERAPEPVRRERARRVAAARPAARRLDLAADPEGRWRAACRCSRSAAASRRPTSRSAAALHQAVHEVAGLRRSPRRDDDAGRGAVRPRARRRRSSPAACSSACSATATIEVNSVHGQGVKRLAPGLRVEARAPDGLVEAFSVRRRAGFNARACNGTRNGRRPRTRSRCACSAPSATRRARYRDRRRGIALLQRSSNPMATASEAQQLQPTSSSGSTSVASPRSSAWCPT